MNDLNPNLIDQCYQNLIRENKSILKLYSGNPIEEGIAPPASILQKCYHDYFKHLSYQPEAQGLKVAREAISHYYYRQTGLSIDPDHILLTASSSESFLHLFSYLAPYPGDEILVPSPGYPLFDWIAKMCHLKLKHYPLDENKGWQIDFEYLEKIYSKKCKALVLVSPHNPTGSVASRETLKQLSRWAEQKNLSLICDEVFSEFYFPHSEKNKHFPRLLEEEKAPLVFTINGISKMFALPSLKLSWILATGNSKKVKSALEYLSVSNDTFLNAHTPIQISLAHLFKEAAPFVKQYSKTLKQNLEFAISKLNSIKNIEFIKPEGSFYLSLNLSKTKLAQKYDEESLVIELMKKHGVFFHPGFFYDFKDGLYLILSFLCSQQKIEKGIESLKSLMEN